MADTVATLQAVITADTRRFEDGLSGAQKGLKGFGASAGAAMSVATKAIDVAIDAAVGLAKSTVGAAVDWDKAFRNIESVTKRSTTSIQKQILNMRSAVAGPMELADAMYDIVGGVADASVHMAILEAANKTAEAGAANLKATTQGLISVMNSYKFSATQAAFASDVLTQTVAKGVGSMDQFVAAMSPIAGLAASLGIKFDDLGAAMAFMTTKGSTAAQAGTQAQAAMTALLKPNAQMNDLLKKVNVSQTNATSAQGKWVTTTKMSGAEMAKANDALAKSQAQLARMQGKKNKDALDNYNISKKQAEVTALQNKVMSGGQSVKQWVTASGSAQKVTAEWLIKTYGLVGALNKLKEAAGGSSQKMAEALGSVEALRAFVALTGGDFAEFEKDFKDGLAGATDAAREIQLKSVSAQFETFKHTLEGAALAIGSVVLPALNGLFTFLNNAATTVGQFAPLITDGISKIAGVFKPLLDEVNRVTAPLQAAIGNIKGAFDKFFSSIAEEPARVIQGDSIVDKIKIPGKSLAEKITPAFEELKKTIAAELAKIDLIGIGTGLINAAATFGENLARNILKGVLDLGTRLSNLLSVSLKNANVDAKLKPITDGIANFIADISKNDFEKPRQLIADIGNAISGFVTQINGLVTDISGKLKPIADGIAAFVGSMTANDFAKPKQLFADIGSALSTFAAKVQPVLDKVGGMITSTLSSLGTGIKDFIANLQGADFSGVAKLLTIIGGALAGLAAVVGTAILGALDGIGKALGPLGTALKDFINALAAAGNGDISGALKGIGDGLLKLGEGALKIPEGIATKLGGLFGIDVQAGLKSWDKVPEQLGTILTTLGKKLDEAIKNLPAKIQELIDTGKQKFSEFVDGIVSKITGLGQKLIDAINAELGKVLSGIKAKIDEIGAAIAGAITGTGAGAPIPKEPGNTTANPNYDPSRPVLNADGTQAQPPKVPGQTKGLDKVLATGKQQRIASGGTSGTAGGDKSGGEGAAYAYIEGFEAIMDQHGYRLGAAIQSALDSVQVNVTGLSAKLAAMFSGADITAAVTNLGTVVSGALATTFGADGAVMVALQPFQDSWQQIFGAGGTIAAAATGMQGVIDGLVGSIVSISGSGTPAVLEFQAVSTSAAPTIVSAWQPVVGVFRQLLMTLEGIAGAAARATGAMGAIPGVGGGGGKGYASGGYTGSGPSNQVAGYVHKNEYVVPSQGALVMRGGDGGGGAISIQSVNVYGVTNPAEMYDAIRREANRRNA